MNKSMCTRSVGILAMALGVGMTGCSPAAPPPNLPPPEYEAPRELDIPTPPQDEDWPPAAAEPAPLPESPPDVPIGPADEDAGVDDGGIDATPDAQ
jgi:hypothetical protein